MTANSTAEKKPGLIQYNFIRKSLGWMGILLPFALVAYSYTKGCHQLQPSISAYYYTRGVALLSGVLFCISLFLVTYKGIEKMDDYTTNLAGAMAFLVAMFPTDIDAAERIAGCNTNLDSTSSFSAGMHSFAAITFFVVLSGISAFIFTKSNKSKQDRTPEKKLRNKVYWACAIVMFVCLVVMGLLKIKGITGIIARQSPAVQHLFSLFPYESIALIAFGISWLVKGESVLTDGGRTYRVIKHIVPGSK